LFRERFSRHGERIDSIGLSITREALAKQADLHLSAEPIEIAPRVWTTGEIAPRPEPEGRSTRHLVRADREWKPDPYKDDMALVLEAEESLVVICGCCHAGLLNTLAHVRRAFEGEITAVAGGFHLVDADEAQLKRTIGALKTYGSPRLYPNHCTGERAYLALAAAFSEGVAPCPVGTVLSF
ncbi:MAG: MBL fold metallo-hydrolase, partial [Chloroflexota bacterium]|nr:MBL fold metallo-hydrolase [Chloroflexota bacterium]